jgi:CubicO group peptidase (beta-lactamase class C family)
MTATLAGLLVQEGLVAWTNTLAGAFPDRAGRMHHRWRGVTLSQLLRHRAGAPDSDWLASRGIWDRLWNHPGTAAEQRSYWLDAVTTHAPQTTPDTSYTYSNTGYVLAGLMLEAATGRAWEELVRERLFRPLGMQSAGFGVPATPGHIDQPWGHQWSGGRPTPIQPGHGADNPAGLGPAGTVHCSLPDLMKYVAFHAAEGRDGGLLTAETFLALHTPRPGESYALGWNVTTRPWAGGRVLNHTGSNLQWYTTAWIAPLKEAALVAVTNIGDNTGSTAASTTDAAVAELIRRYLPD